MILGIGCDLCRVERIAAALQNERFAMRVYTDAERARLENLCPERRAERAAGLFAAKEAVAKALGTGFSGFGFADVEILARPGGAPQAILHGAARSRLPAGARAHVSISHDAGIAQAFAVIEREP